MTAPLIFLDCETTGLQPGDEVWEFAAVLRRSDGVETEIHEFVDHNLDRATCLPEPFRADHDARYQHDAALLQHEFADVLMDIFPETDDYRARPHIVGAVPNFDTEHLAKILRRHGREPFWHHRLIDVETLTVGYLRGITASALPALLTQPWDSDGLSRAVGVDPEQFERHTAMGDVRWAMAIYDAVMGGAA